MKILPILIVVAVALSVVAASGRRRSLCKRSTSKTCPKYCPKYYRPVCAFDGVQFKLFANQCLLQSQNYCGGSKRRLFRGGYHLSHCEKGGSSGSDECGKLCPKTYKPICATNENNFKIFANDCFLYRYNRCFVQPGARKYDETDFDLCQGECSLGCTKELNPQCGYNGKVYKEFANPCLMRAYNNCDVEDGKVFGLVDLALCRSKPKCPRACTREYNPVCGYNGVAYKEFSNRCLLNAYNDCDVKDGRRFDEVALNLCKPKPQCPRPCTREFNPVCGFNGLVYKQFSNPCVFQEFNDCEVKDGKVFEKVELSLCKPKCPRPCTLEYNPVCGFNGAVYKEFGNECALNAYNECDASDGEKYIKTDLELCQPAEDCPKFCTKEYNPVCGFNGAVYKEFGNRCMFNAYNACDAMDGKKFREVELNLCKPKPKCPRPCTAEFNPVCGFNGLVYKQFGNPCQFQVFNECEVKDGRVFEKVELSLCEPKLECPRFCTLQYDPVCGFNGKVYKEFGNGCQLGAFNACEAKDGEKFTAVELGLCQTKPDCPKACTAEFNPVCGFNGNTYKVFGNPCSLSAFNDCDAKDGEKFEQVDLDLCEPKCPRACTLEFNPVCGFNGKVYKKFGNACALSAFNDCDVPKGSPKFDQVDLDQCDCPQRCPQTLIYAPVCGYNGKKYRIFDSNCAMNNANCQNPNESAFAEVDFTLCNDIKCPRKCDKKLDPVCAFDGKTYRQFNNKCLLQEFNDCDQNLFQYFNAVTNKKMCVVEKPKCPTICPAIYAPVCGRNAKGDYKSFASECNQSAFNCLNSKNQYTGKYDLSFCDIEFP